MAKLAAAKQLAKFTIKNCTKSNNAGNFADVKEKVTAGATSSLKNISNAGKSLAAGLTKEVDVYDAKEAKKAAEAQNDTPRP